MSSQDAQSIRAGPTSRERSQQPPDQSDKIAQIEKSVTHLLVATKQLLEILTAWSRREASEVNVSDVYVRLGYEFNIACRAFNGVGVDTQDLGPVPELLRGILEDALSNEPSQQSLEQYLPHIRDIIVTLLQGLKKKQQRLRQKDTREGSPYNLADSGSTRESSTGSVRSSAPSTVDARVAATPGNRSISNEINSQISGAPSNRTPSVPNGRASPARSESGQPPKRAASTARSIRGGMDSSAGSGPFNDDPIPAPYAAPVAAAQPAVDLSTAPTGSPFDTFSEESQPRGQPPQHDALAALQRGGELERRASRRFSAYQIQKHLGPSAAGGPMIPPSQHSPIPNRGREVREGMFAARMKASPLANKDSTRHARDQSPTRSRTPQGRARTVQTTEPADDLTLDSPTVKTPEDKYNPPVPESIQPLPTAQPQPGPWTSAQPSVQSVAPAPAEAEERSVTPPQPSKELTIFLQYKHRIKKITLSEGMDELSIARLQLAFIDKFAWDTHSNGAELPEIYIQDSASGIRYELEDMSDVKENSVLVLNVDALDDVKRHFDDGVGSIKQLVEGIRSTIDGQQSVLQLVAETQQDAAKSIARFNAMPPQPPASSAGSAVTVADAVSGKGGAGRLAEVQSLRRDLATMRQSYTTFTADIEISMADLRSKANNIKTAAITASIPSFDNSSGRAYVNTGRKTLSEDSEKIINRVDDLQDIVEDLRKDVVTRGVRPIPRQLESVNKEISIATAELKKLQEFVKREKPVWTKIWRSELESVYDDQKSLKMQEELAADLEKDLSEAANTFALVEEATKQQNVQTVASTPTRTRSRTATIDVDPHKAKDTVLGEVRALQPNHETRLEAITRAEKARLSERETRGEGAFKKELGNFIDEGRFKKRGGVEEVERLRKTKEDALRREAWEGKSSGSNTPALSEDNLGAPSMSDAAAALGRDSSSSTSDADLPTADKQSSRREDSDQIFEQAVESLSGTDEPGAATPDFVEAAEHPTVLFSSSIHGNAETSAALR